MPAAQVSCPGCSRALAVEQSQLGRKIRCPHCHGAFVVAVAQAPSPPRAAAVPVRPNVHLLRISARTRIDWPDRCPCCLGAAGASLEVFTHRVEGKRVIRVTGKSWVVPYCGRCLGHARASRAAEEEETAAEQARAEAVALSTKAIGWTVGIAALCFLFCVSQVQAGSVGGAVLFGLIGLLGSPAACFYFYAQATRAEGRARYETGEAGAHRDEVKRLLTATCVCEGEAVAYDGWAGTVHTFRFTNGRYGGMVAEANAQKVVP